MENLEVKPEVYESPEVVELGDVEELTFGSLVSNTFDTTTMYFDSGTKCC